MKTWILLGFLVVVGVFGACGKGGGGGGSPLVDKLPASAAGVMVMNRSGSEAEVRDALKTSLESMPVPEKIPDCAVDLIAKVDVLAVSFGDDPKVVVVAHGAGLRAAFEACMKSIEPKFAGKDEGQATGYGDGEGKDLYVTWLDADTVIAGGNGEGTMNAEYVTKLRSLPPLSGNAALSELRKKVDGGAPIWFAVDVSQSKELSRAIPPQIGAKRVWGEFGADWTGKLTVEVGDADKAKLVAEQAKMILGRATRELGPDFAKSVDISTDGALVVFKADVAAAARKVLGKDPPKAAASLAVVGVAAAVAIPAFMKNARKAKTSEATLHVKKLYDGARAYYEENHKFPPSVGPTPPLGSCCKNPDKKCAPDPKLWAEASWQALMFSMDDPSQYSYTFEAGGDTFTVRANGDLDCDGIYSTFEMAGKVQSDGSITGSAGMFKDQELE